MKKILNLLKFIFTILTTLISPSHLPIPLLSSRKLLLSYYYYRRPIGDWHAWSETHRKPRHASSKTDMPYRRSIWDLDMLLRRLTWLIGDPLKTDLPVEADMTNRRPIEDWPAWSETHQRPKCLVGDGHPWLETRRDLNMLYQRPTCLIGDPSETFTGDGHAWSETHRRPFLTKNLFQF